MKKSPRMTVNCGFCGTPKQVVDSEKNRKKTHFCGTTCHGKWHSTDKNPYRKNKTRQCQQCGNDFDLREKRVSHEQKFCSSKCYGEFAKDHPGVLQPIQAKKRFINECVTCGKSFEVHRYRKDAKFCSRECHYSLNREIVVCKHCKIEFTAQKHKRRQYCSDKCAKNNVINSSKGEKEIFSFLVELGLNPRSNNGINIQTGTEFKFFKPDIIIDKKIIEFYGDYWHCSSLIFEENDYNSSIGMTAKEKREFDEERKTLLENEGYEVLIIWEHEWVKDKKAMKNKIENFLRYS